MRRTRLAAVLTAALLTATAAVTGAAAGIATEVAAPPQPAHALPNGLALTPPMGFNNWNTTHCRAEFNEAMVKGIADLFVSRGLKDARLPVRQHRRLLGAAAARRAGQPRARPGKRFPNGIKAVADYVHSKGLKFGIYTSAGTKTCNDAGFPGGLNNEQRDANLFASWGVDYLKYDNCNNQGVDARMRVHEDARRARGHRAPDRLLASASGARTSRGPGLRTSATCGAPPATSTTTYAKMVQIAKRNMSLAQYAKPGAWNDPDMLEVGNGGMTPAEYRSHFSLWAVMAAPLLIGSDLRRVNEDTFTILKNTDVIAIDQDALGKQATIVSQAGGRHILSKPLANGDRAVALFNEMGSTQTISTTAAAIGLGGSASYDLKDLWTKSNRTTTGAISASVPAHATVLYRVSRGGTTPPPNRYEAESATISQGTVDSNHAGFSGAGFVNYANAAGSYVEFSVNAAAGRAGHPHVPVRQRHGR